MRLTGWLLSSQQTYSAAGMSDLGHTRCWMIFRNDTPGLLDHQGKRQPTFNLSQDSQEPPLNGVARIVQLLHIAIALQLCYVGRAAQEQRQPLVQLLRLDIQDAPRPIRCPATRLQTSPGSPQCRRTAASCACTWVLMSRTSLADYISLSGRQAHRWKSATREQM